MLGPLGLLEPPHLGGADCYLLGALKKSSSPYSLCSPYSFRDDPELETPAPSMGFSRTAFTEGGCGGV